MPPTENRTFGNITIRVKNKKDDYPEIGLDELSEKSAGTYVVVAKIKKIDTCADGCKSFQVRKDSTDIILSANSTSLKIPKDLKIENCARFKVEVIKDCGCEKKIIISEITKIECTNAHLEEIIIDPENRSGNQDIEFTIESPILESLTSQYRRACHLIKKSISEGRSILIRHHADTDGYTGAIALEKAILPMIGRMQGDKEKWFSFDRTPSSTPFYEYRDLLKDLAYAKKTTERFRKLMPLIILVDNGSTEEDLMSLRKAKIYGIPIIVVDHHYTEVKDGKSIVDDYVDVHINPYLVGSDKNMTAGMLAYELSRMLNPTSEDLKIIPALAGAGDRSEGPEFERYLKNSGRTLEVLKKIALCIDYEAFYIKFMQDSGIIYDLINPTDNSASLKLLYRDIELILDRQKVALKHYAKEENLKNGILLSVIDIARTTVRNDFPPPGKAIGLLNDELNEKHNGKPIVSLGYGSDFITIRSNKICEKMGFNMNIMVSDIQKKMPHALVEGGGHEVAGSISFIESSQDEVISAAKDYIRNL